MQLTKYISVNSSNTSKTGVTKPLAFDLLLLLSIFAATKGAMAKPIPGGGYAASVSTAVSASPMGTITSVSYGAGVSVGTDHGKPAAGDGSEVSVAATSASPSIALQTRKSSLLIATNPNAGSGSMPTAPVVVAPVPYVANTMGSSSNNGGGSAVLSAAVSKPGSGPNVVVAHMPGSDNSVSVSASANSPGAAVASAALATGPGPVAVSVTASSPGSGFVSGSAYSEKAGSSGNVGNSGNLGFSGSASSNSDSSGSSGSSSSGTGLDSCGYSSSSGLSNSLANSVAGKSGSASSSNADASGASSEAKAGSFSDMGSSTSFSSSGRSRKGDLNKVSLFDLQKKDKLSDAEELSKRDFSSLSNVQSTAATLPIEPSTLMFVNHPTSSIALTNADSIVSEPILDTNKPQQKVENTIFLRTVIQTPASEANEQPLSLDTIQAVDTDAPSSSPTYDSKCGDACEKGAIDLLKQSGTCKDASGTDSYNLCLCQNKSVWAWKKQCIKNSCNSLTAQDMIGMFENACKFSGFEI